MLITRGVEERGHILYQPGEDPRLVLHRPRQRGARRSASRPRWAPDDVGTPLHRDMGVHITRGVEPWRIFANYMGRVDGPTRRAATATSTWPTRASGLIAMVSHLPAMLPVAVGCALAFRIREEKRVAVGWFGEGAAARGDAHEAMNLAGVRRLPVVFICDNNQWAYSTPTHLGFATEHIADRAAGLRLRGRRRRRHRRARRLPRGEARDREGARGRRADADRVPDAAHGGPRRPRRRLLRPKELFEEWAEARPDRALPHLAARATPTSATRRRTRSRADVKKLLNDAIKRAEESPLPDPATLTEGVYATPEDLDTPHHK